jgi:hypothetical protein
VTFAETDAAREQRRQRIAATGFLPRGSHFDGSCEVWKCPDCNAHVHIGASQMPDELEIHAREHRELESSY